MRAQAARFLISSSRFAGGDLLRMASNAVVLRRWTHVLSVDMDVDWRARPAETFRQVQEFLRRRVPQNGGVCVSSARVRADGRSSRQPPPARSSARVVDLLVLRRTRRSPYPRAVHRAAQPALFQLPVSLTCASVAHVFLTHEPLAPDYGGSSSVAAFARSQRDYLRWPPVPVPGLTRPLSASRVPRLSLGPRACPAPSPTLRSSVQPTPHAPLPTGMPLPRTLPRSSTDAHVTHSRVAGPERARLASALLADAVLGPLLRQRE